MNNCGLGCIDIINYQTASDALGTYRLILALLVLYSHSFGTIFGWNPGVVAVISFLMISGYVMTALMSKNYPTARDIPAFYLDRAARLYPQYLFYLCLTIILVATVGLQSDFVSDHRPASIALNFAILPLGFYMFGLEHALYLPPAWSLGLEVSFYLFFPSFFLANERTKYMMAAASVAVFLLAFSGSINTDWFGYRLLPGTFFIFAIGSWLARGNTRVALGATALFATLLIVCLIPSIGVRSYNAEVALGGILGVFAVSSLTRLKRNRVDDYLGNISYGVFLNHFMFIFIYQRYGIGLNLFLPVFSVLLSAATFELVESPSIKWRRRLRQTPVNAL
ncbi:acyltransferase [Rhizobium sp. rho-1.1]|uniref:acyltransferase family protein n=1 Tax=Rhizobium sp. rho-1.1 TaxID=2506429 RepID=UPI0032AF8F35